MYEEMKKRIDTMKTREEVTEEERKNANFLYFVFLLERYDLVEVFEKEAFTNEIIELYIEEIVKFCQLPECLLDNLMILDYVIQNKESLDNLPILLFPKQILEDDILLEKYATILGIERRTILERLIELYEENDEIFDTLNPLMLAEEIYSYIPNSIFRKLILYPDIQNMVIRLNRKEITIIQILLNKLVDTDFDNTLVIYNILHNIRNYKELIKEIKIDEFTEDQIENLIQVLQYTDNKYQIRKQEDLKKENYLQRKEQRIKSYEEEINKGNYDAKKLKSIIFENYYGLDMEEIEFIIQRYCHNMREINESDLDCDIVMILSIIYYLYKLNDIDALLTFYHTSDFIVLNDYYTFPRLESAIRQAFANIYNKSLYKIEENVEDEMNMSNIGNEMAYEKLTAAQIDGEPKIYIPNGDFKLQISVLGAYNDYVAPDNFEREWNCPKVSSHGICTSFISNSQLATARQFHPILGFSTYEESALLLSGNEDLCSKHANKKYKTSYELKRNARFHTPEGIIENTRHNHNEVVIERKYNKENHHKKVKRQPDYIVFIIDDVNNKYNFMTKEETLRELIELKEITDEDAMTIRNSKASSTISTLVSEGKITEETADKIRTSVIYEETIQAARDFHVPIVMIDRLQTAKKEKANCERDVQKFKKELKETDMRKALIRFFNNMVGCRKFAIQIEKEYHKVFNQQTFIELYKEILEEIKKIEDENQKNHLIQCLYKILLEEIEKYKYESNEFADELERIATQLSSYIIKEIQKKGGK